MVAVKVKVTREDHTALVPVVIPELEAVRAFAAGLHAKGEYWNGEAFGWSAEYNPEKAESPLDSNMTFTPADFCIGESAIWFFPSCGKTAKMPLLMNF